MAEKTARFEYHGPPAFIVELGLEVTDGWVGDGPLALEHAVGFAKTTKKPKAQDEADE